MLTNFKNGLSYSEMKSIKGGVEYGGNTCGYRTSSGSVACGVSKAVAQAAVSGGGNWCCDSCSSTSYCGGSTPPPPECIEGCGGGVE